MADKKIVGIDFTNREVRIAQIAYGRGLPKLERYAVGPIPDGVFSGGRLVEPGRLSETIKELLRGYRFNAKRAVLGISGRYGVTRMVVLPKMTAAQTRDAINLQLNQYVPFPPADSLYDFKVLRELKEEEQPSQEVLLVATRRSSIQPLLRVMKGAGLHLIGIKITTLASFTLFEDIYMDSEQAVAFVDVRDSVTDISFVADNYFRLSRSIEFGLITLTERIRTKMGLSYMEAVDHLYRNKVDLMESYRPSDMDTAEEGTIAPPPSDVPEGIRDPAELDKQLGLVRGDETAEKAVRDAVLRSMGQFVNELMRSIRYFESQSKRRARVGRIVMFGYIGGMDGLSEYLAEQTGLEVTVVTEFPGVESVLDPADEQEIRGREAMLVVPIGLAVEGAKKKKIDLNLVPRETMYRRKSFNALKFAIVIVVILAAILANIYIQRDQEYNEFKDQEQELVRQIASIQDLYDRSQEFQTYISQIEGKLTGVVTLAGAQPPWPVIMDELGRVMRESAWIDSMHWDAQGATWEIHGWAFSTEELQKLLVNMYHSQILVMPTPGDIEPQNLDFDEGVLGQRFGGRGYGSGFGFGTEPPSSPPDYGDEQGSTWDAGQYDGIPGMENQGSSRPRPEPMYKLPEGGGGGLRDIEWYFRGYQYFYPVFYEFTFNGTINPAVMLSGGELFGELADLIGAGGAGTGGGMTQAGGGGGSIGFGGQDGSSGGAAGGDDGGEGDI